MSAFSFNQSYNTFLALKEHSLEPTIELDLSLYYIIGKKLVWNTIWNMISLLFINHGAGEFSLQQTALLSTSVIGNVEISSLL